MRKTLNKFFKKNADDDGLYLKITQKNELIYEIPDSIKEFRIDFHCIADTFIEIVSVKPDISFSKLQYSLEYRILGRRNTYIIKFKNRFPVNRVITAFEKKGIEIHNEKLFKQACRLYLKFCLKNTRIKSCGWVQKNKACEYIGVTKDFNTAMDDFLLYSPESLELQLPDDAQAYRELLEGMINFAPRNITYTLLAYTFFAFSFYFISDDVGAESLPLINISGVGEDDNLTPNFMANLYSNMFYRTIPFIHSIDLRSSTSIHSKQPDIARNLYRINDCPIIITSKRKTTSISSGVGSKIVDFIIEHDLRTFPVFITDSPIEHDRVISIHLEDVEIDTVKLNDIFKNFDAFPMLIREFVDYLQELSDETNWEDYFAHVLYDTFFIGRTDINLLHSHALLNYGFQVFLKFCEDTEIFNNAQTLEYSKTANQVFKEMTFCTVLPRTLLKDNSVEVFLKYVTEGIGKDFTFPYDHWEGKVGSEQLIYLNYDAYWDDFKKVSGKQLTTALLKRNFEEILSKLKLIRHRNNKSTFYMTPVTPENIDPLQEKKKMLAIRKKVLFDIVAKDNACTV